jgi:hypothetical protein
MFPWLGEKGISQKKGARLRKRPLVSWLREKLAEEASFSGREAERPRGRECELHEPVL